MAADDTSAGPDEPVPEADDVRDDTAEGEARPEAPDDPGDDELLEAAAIAEEPPAAAEEHLDLDDGEGTLAVVTAERDEFRETMLRVKAEFDNYRKRTARDTEAMAAQAAGRIAESLLLVIDACEAAIGQGAADVEPIHKQLLDTLAKEGLERIEAVGAPFDPNLHEAVLHEPAEDDQDGDVVVESLRTGYLWRGQVLRPSMVKVRG